MRVLSISHRLQHPQIDNHTIFNAPTLFDYDAIVFDAAGVFDTIREAAGARAEFLTHADQPVVNGDSVDGVAGLADLLQRRREEVSRALERGATVVVFMGPPSRFGGVAGFGGVDRYFYVPAPDGMAWDSTTIRGGEGSQAVVVDHDHPFVQVMEAYEREVLYRAYFNDRAPGFARHARVFLRSPGGAPIGVEFPVLRGRVVFMPTPKYPGGDWFVAAEGAAMLTAFGEHLGADDSNAPYWVGQLPVPGLAERETAVTDARSALDQAESALVAARDGVRERAPIRDVLWASGDTALTAAAIACFEAIGFEASETPEGRAVLNDGDTSVHLVVGGADEAVGMTPHYRLRQHLDAILAERAVAARGVVVANGQRGNHPDERQRELEDALRVASEATRYAVLTSRSLFAAAVAALEGASADTLAAIRQRIASTDGVVTLDDLLGSGAPTSATASTEEPATPSAVDVDSNDVAPSMDTTGVTGARAGEVEAP